MNRSMTLGCIDGPDADQRLELELVQGATGQLELVLSERHYAEGIGWFTQRSLNLDAHQVAQLKRLLQVQDISQDCPKVVRQANARTLKLHARSLAEPSESLADVG